MITHLEIGGGTLAPPGSLNVDPAHGTPPGDPRLAGLLRPGYEDIGLQVPAEGGIPLIDGCVERVRASHVLEHIPAGYQRIDVMNEAHRVLVPGGILDVALPVIGYEDRRTGEQRLVSNWRPYADPTHVSFWWMPHSFLYFVPETHGGLAPNAEYGIRPWKLVHWDVGGDPFWEGTATLERLDPAG